MNIAKLDTAINAAMRFVLKGEDAKRRWEKDWAEASVRLRLTNKEMYSNVSAENAACKRASMDLTRELANLRRGSK